MWAKTTSSFWTNIKTTCKKSQPHSERHLTTAPCMDCSQAVNLPSPVLCVPVISEPAYQWDHTVQPQWRVSILVSAWNTTTWTEKQKPLIPFLDFSHESTVLWKATFWSCLTLNISYQHHTNSTHYWTQNCFTVTNGTKLYLWCSQRLFSSLV